ncbi:hypothetical protein EV424DRAFT_1535646 [Suillus variegatus]|nr:hypothetical protein EV424DRAFT_1535646 [Suillus variegatus]
MLVTSYDLLDGRARKRQQKDLQAPISEASDRRASSPESSPDQDDDTRHHISTTAQLKAPMSLSNISDIRTSIAGWQTEWGPAATWAKNFHHTLSRVQEKGRRATDKFFSQCEDHVREGRAILCDLQLLAHHPPNKGSKQVKDTYIQIYDLLSAVLMEVFFFELKLDEYAPAVPLSKLSEVRYYHSI